MQKIKVFINGFGRIGRNVLRILLKSDRFEIVGINDIFPLSNYRYLLQYDSVYGVFPEKITQNGDFLFISDHKIRLFCEEDPSALEISSLKIDILFQCSGVFLTIEENRPFLQQGVKRVILSAPPLDEMPTYIMGFNHHTYQNEAIISNSSCSVNAIAPIMQQIEAHYGIRYLCVNMIHSYTGDQNLLDDEKSIPELRRVRSATQNILPLHSSATSVLERLFPHLKERCYTKSIRVPTHATTLYDFTFITYNPTDTVSLHTLFTECSQTTLQNIIDIDTHCRVSSDFIHNPHSATIDLPLSEVLDLHCIKLSAWQDNEYGYAFQLVQMAEFISRQSQVP